MDNYYIVYDGDLVALVSGYDVFVTISPFHPYHSEVFEVLTESEFLEKYPEEVDFCDLSCAEARINTKE